MKIELKTITPDDARKYLETNTDNRSVRPGHVKALARAMKNGEWKLLHQPIAFDEKGVLLDGQHRLLAVLQSGVTIETLVAWEAERASFDCIDIGAKRSLGDITGLSPDRAAILRWVTALVHDDYTAMSPQACEAVWPYIRSSVDLMIDECSSKRRYVTTAPIMSAGAIRIIGGANKHYVLASWRSMVLLDFQGMSPSVGSFVRQLMEGTAKRRQTDRLNFARAWMVFDEANEDVNRLRISDPDDARMAARATMLTKMGRTIAPLGLAGKRAVA